MARKKSTTINEDVRFDLSSKTLWALGGVIVFVAITWANLASKIDQLNEKQIETATIISKNVESISAIREDVATIKGRMGLEAYYKTQQTQATPTTQQPQSQPQDVQQSTDVRVEPPQQPQPQHPQNPPVERPPMPEPIPSVVEGILDGVLPIPTPVRTLLHLL